MWIYRTIVHSLSNRYLALAVRGVNDPKLHIKLLYINLTFEGNKPLDWEESESVFVPFIVCK